MINETEMRGSAGNGHYSANLMFAFLTGASIGAAAGLLLAPRTGHESRDQLRGYWQKTRERVQRLAQEAPRYAREAASKVGEAATDISEEMTASGRGERQGGTRRS